MRLPTLRFVRLASLVSASPLFGSRVRHEQQQPEQTRMPPVPRRDEDRVVSAGIAPPGWTFPRQSETSEQALLDPPVDVRDPYGWLRDETRSEPEVLEHLRAENAYTEAGQAHLSHVRETLYQEMLAAIRETDYSLPRPYGRFYQYSRTFLGKAYPRYCRARRTTLETPLAIDWDGSVESPVLPNEEITLDVNELAEGKDYCSVESVTDSPSQTLLAYTVDHTGDEIYQLFVKDLTTGDIVDHDEELEIDGDVVWGKDDSTLFYVKMDSAQRSYQVYRRRLGSDQPDELLYEEKDETFWVGIDKSDDKRYLFVSTEGMETSEVYYLDLDDPRARLECVAKRRAKVLYSVSHQKGHWWIMSNTGGLPNLALWIAPVIPNCEDTWEPVNDADGERLFDGSYDKSLDGLSMFANHVVLSGRTGGLPRLWFIRLGDDGKSVTNFVRLEFPEEAYDVCEGSNYEYETDRIAVAYDSLVTPTQVLEIRLDDPSDRLALKERQVPGYVKSLYGCERITVLSRDGSTEIPVSLVYRRDTMERHKATGERVPLVLYGKNKDRAIM
jgi:oligopeptidase B